MTREDDVEAFLLAFERTATREGWPIEKWAGILAPFLVGEAQKAYHDLSPQEAESYPHLKAEILAREGVTSAVRAQKYHAWGYAPGVPPRSQMFDLIHLATRWLRPEVNNAEKVIEVLVMDRYLRSLPAPLRKWVGQGDPSTINEFVDLVERQLAAEELSRQPQIPATRSPKPPAWAFKSGKQPAMPERGEERPEVVKGLGTIGRLRPETPGYGYLKCFKCNQMGHIAKYCKSEEKMECNVVKYSEAENHFCGNIIVPRHPVGTYPYLVWVTLNGKKAEALADSGSAITLVTLDLLSDHVLDYDFKTGVTCIHGDVKHYPTAVVSIGIGTQVVDLRVGVVPHLPHQVILGRNVPGFDTLVKFNKPKKGSPADNGDKNEI
ncbi:uncharacterized protein LOC131722718 [Acipenser ruthenus]|uniref:uncharacterized protein LOC131722718 n=1 Tax=Acipenser ruthenus TaxID=7906 RepID=UPI0027403989|nr:uncharacterized protein LOC131722718 [Acipenser ruthenus]